MGSRGAFFAGRRLMSGTFSPIKELPHVLKQLRCLVQSYGTAGIMHCLVKGPARESSAPPASTATPILVPTETHDLRPKTGEHLNDIHEELEACTRCRLHQDRTNLVFGEGPDKAHIAFVGEGPGFEEDRQGRPFVGRAGKLLEKMIRSISMDRKDVYICNVVKCRPPKNRTPQQDEIEVCYPFLARQLTALSPRIIIALGACAAQTLLSRTTAISQLRGKIHSWRGIPLVCTYHPAYLLRNPVQKSATWQDILIACSILQRKSEENTR